MEYKYINIKFDEETLKKFSKYGMIAGIVMMLIGLGGILLPPVMSLTIVTLMAWMFIFSAFVQGYNTYKNYKKSVSAWLKAILSLITGFLFLIFPVGGIAVVGMLLAVYLMIDAYSSIAFAFEYKPNKGWWMMLINGFFSLALSFILIVGWPFNSVVLVGLFAGASLFFDGVALLTFAINAKKLNSKNDENSENSEK
ncbi:MAG: hypothetical protein GXO12_01620 [Epsilonproteobacteria bacterium]|nr:hypothetical protein [Campylobacterota bacterium]